MDSGTGQSMADAVSEMIQKWHLPLQRIIGLCYDTTASNSGKQKGSVKLVEAVIKHACMWLACRHHVGELHIKHVNIRVRGDTTGNFVSIVKYIIYKYHLRLQRRHFYIKMT